MRISLLKVFHSVIAVAIMGHRKREVCLTKLNWNSNIAIIDAPIFVTSLPTFLKIMKLSIHNTTGVALSSTRVIYALPS